MVSIEATQRHVEFLNDEIRRLEAQQIQIINLLRVRKEELMEQQAILAQKRRTRQAAQDRRDN